MNKFYLIFLSFILLLIIPSCKKNGTSNNTEELPSLNTTVTNVTENSAQFGSSIYSDGGATITSKGFCYSTSANPTISGNTIRGTGTENMSATVINLTSNTQYFVRAYATNSVRTAYGQQEMFTTLHFLGESYGGGIIFYIDPSGLHGLIRSQYSLSGDSNIVEWGCSGIDIPGTSTSLGSGQENTKKIIKACSTLRIPARICDDLVLNGFDDWFLPSRDEFSKLCHSLLLSTTMHWWTSSQYDKDRAYISGVECYSSFFPKEITVGIWPVRKF